MRIFSFGVGSFGDYVKDKEDFKDFFRLWNFKLFLLIQMFFKILIKNAYRSLGLPFHGISFKNIILSVETYWQHPAASQARAYVLLMTYKARQQNNKTTTRQNRIIKFTAVNRSRIKNRNRKRSECSQPSFSGFRIKGEANLWHGADIIYFFLSFSFLACKRRPMTLEMICVSSTSFTFFAELACIPKELVEPFVIMTEVGLVDLWRFGVVLAIELNPPQ